jgi:hypothetical protein
MKPWEDAGVLNVGGLKLRRFKLPVNPPRFQLRVEVLVTNTFGIAQRCSQTLGEHLRAYELMFSDREMRRGTCMAGLLFTLFQFPTPPEYQPTAEVMQIPYR